MSIGAKVYVASSGLHACDDGMNQVAMLQTDLDKPFGRVKHDVLFYVLERANIGIIILEEAKLAHRSCATKSIVNKELTEKINALSSVVPGCPLSPLFLNMYLKLSRLSISGSKDCRTYRFGDTEIKIMSYADYIAVFCSEKESDSASTASVKRFLRPQGQESTGKIVVDIGTGR